MYNRYIPKNDGSYHRRPVPEPPKRAEPEQSPAPSPPEPPQQQKPVTQTRPAGFLKNLLPKSFDTGDLIIVLLLLLMAGDCKEEQNSALLTLALYFFM